MLEVDHPVATPVGLQAAIAVSLADIARTAGADIRATPYAAAETPDTGKRTIDIGYPALPTAMLSDAFFEVRIRVSSSAADFGWTKEAAIEIAEALCGGPFRKEPPIMLRPTGGVWGDRRLGTWGVVIPIEAVVQSPGRIDG